MIEARADEPHHPDLEALPSPPPHNYTCIIRTHTHTHMCAHTYTPIRNPQPESQPQAPQAEELVIHHGATTILACTETLSQGGVEGVGRGRGGGGWRLRCFIEMIFIFLPGNHSSSPCLCIGFFFLLPLCLCT